METGNIATAQKKKKTSTAGKGCFLQLLGLLCLGGWLGGPIFGLLGTVFAVILFVYGSQASQYFVCGNCGTRLEDKTVQECPSCHRQFE
jgi:hypothetical protein